MSTDGRRPTFEVGSKLLAAGRAANPEIDPDPEAFLALLEHVPAVASTEFDHLRVDDIFVVCAALAGHEAAQSALEKRVRAAASKVRYPDHDELVQRCWVRLFVSEDAPPRVLRYVGAGNLDGLFRVTATRVALNAARDTPATDTLESTLDLESFELALDSQLATAEVEQVFKAGLTTAIGELEEDERLLLRLHLVDGLGIDHLSSILGVHRATAARRLERARNRVADRVRAAMVRQLGDQGVRDSLLRHIRSQLDLSLSRIL